MFGYVTINKPELRIKEFELYHSYYCGLCEALRRSCGRTGQLTLSYDMTFLAILLSGLYEPEEDFGEYRCLMHPAAKHPRTMNEYTAYAADMNILLSYYNLQDDWEDDRKLTSGALSLTLRRRVGKLKDRYPRQSEAVRTYLEELHRCEEERRPSLDMAAGLTGRMLAEIFVRDEDAWADTLRRMGFHLGRFIYLMDAWDDREADARSGSYNPWLLQEGSIPTRDDVTAILNMIMGECALAFEQLPILKNAEILRNIIYSGVWTRFEKENKDDA